MLHPGCHSNRVAAGEFRPGNVRPGLGQFCPKPLAFSRQVLTLLETMAVQGLQLLHAGAQGPFQVPATLVELLVE